MEWKEQNISNLRKSFHQTSLLNIIEEEYRSHIWLYCIHSKSFHQTLLNIIEEELIKFSLCKETPAQISYLIKKLLLVCSFLSFLVNEHFTNLYTALFIVEVLPQQTENINVTESQNIRGQDSREGYDKDKCWVWWTQAELIFFTKNPNMRYDEHWAGSQVKKM